MLHSISAMQHYKVITPNYFLQMIKLYHKQKTIKISRQRFIAVDGICLFLYRVINYFRIIKLATAVAADVAVIPRNYVVGTTIRASHYAALHW